MCVPRFRLNSVIIIDHNDHKKNFLLNFKNILGISFKINQFFIISENTYKNVEGIEKREKIFYLTHASLSYFLRPVEGEKSNFLIHRRQQNFRAFAPRHLVYPQKYELIPHQLFDAC